MFKKLQKIEKNISKLKIISTIILIISIISAVSIFVMCFLVKDYSIYLRGIVGIPLLGILIQVICHVYANNVESRIYDLKLKVLYFKEKGLDQSFINNCFK